MGIKYEPNLRVERTLGHYPKSVIRKVSRNVTVLKLPSRKIHDLKESVNVANDNDNTYTLPKIVRKICNNSLLKIFFYLSSKSVSISHLYTVSKN